jgi:hypothetical protein
MWLTMDSTSKHTIQKPLRFFINNWRFQQNRITFYHNWFILSHVLFEWHFYRNKPFFLLWFKIKIFDITFCFVVVIFFLCFFYIFAQKEILFIFLIKLCYQRNWKYVVDQIFFHVAMHICWYRIIMMSVYIADWQKTIIVVSMLFLPENCTC